MARSSKTDSVLGLVLGASEHKPQAEQGELPADERRKAEKNEKRRKKVLTAGMETGLAGAARESRSHNPALRSANEPVKVYSRPKSLEYQIVDVSLTLVCEQLGAAIERFNVCSCDRCCAEITARAMKLLPRRFIHVRSVDDENAVNEALDKMRPEAVKTLARVIISTKTNPIHG